jgi:threonine/homoserine/homoserine lactone efflux protein
MLSILLPMFLFCLAGAISPGPVNVIAAHLGARLGFVRALPHVLGASLSYAAIVWLVALSGVGLFVAAGPDSPALLRVFCAMSGGVCYVSVGACAALGTVLRRWLAPARHQLLFNRAMALMLVAAVAAMLA